MLTLIEQQRGELGGCLLEEPNVVNELMQTTDAKGRLIISLSQQRRC